MVLNISDGKAAKLPIGNLAKSFITLPVLP